MVCELYLNKFSLKRSTQEKAEGQREPLGLAESGKERSPSLDV